MITSRHGSLLQAPAEALVNTVNTVGVMGKGIALMFKQSFPANFHAYEEACKRKEVRVGRMFITETDASGVPRYIVNFPTKQHWRNPSRLEWIVEGLQDLRCVIEDKKISSIALPPLGCGNGGLDWAVVRPEIEKALGSLHSVHIDIFEPAEQRQNIARDAMPPNPSCVR